MTTARFLLAAAAFLAPAIAVAAPTRVFVQWDEQHLVAGDLDDAPNDVSWTLDWFGVAEVTMPAVTPGPGQDLDQIKAATMQIVDQQWAELDTEFVLTRPVSGDFLMITMGGWGGLINLGGAGGWGIVDCYDDNKTAVAFTFSESLKGDDELLDPIILAQVISQEIAHTIGLEHLDANEKLIMFPSTTGAGPHEFGTECFDIVQPIMDPNHPEYCLDHPGCPMGQQNDLAHLLEYLGPAGGDPDPTGGSSGSGSGGDDGGGSGTGDGDPGGSSGDASGSASDAGDGSGSAGTGDGDDGSSGSEAETDGGGAATGDGDGCSCRATDAPPPLALSLLAGLVVARRRR